mgnify:FL=1
MALLNFFKKKEKKVEEKEEFELFFYVVKSNENNIMKQFDECFHNQSEGCYDSDGTQFSEKTTKFIIKFSDGSTIKGTLDNSEEAQDQSVGMYNYFSKVHLDNEELKSNILKQISMFNCIISVNFSYPKSKKESEEVQNRIKDIYKCIENCGGFIFMDLDNIFHPNGKLLISKDGHTEFTHFIPIVYGELK